MFRKLIGYFLISIPFILVTAPVLYVLGVMKVLLPLGISLAVIAIMWGCFMVGFALIEDD